MWGWATVAAAADLEGTWRLELVVRSVAQVAVLKDAASTTTSVAVVHVRREGDALVHEQDLCAVDVATRNPFASTVLPQALVDAVPTERAPISLAGGSYVVDLGTSHLGYDDAVSHGLPSRPDDPGVRDVDHDGLPGATVLVRVAGLGTFRVGVAQRSRAVLRGVVADDRVTGQVSTVDFAQTVLAADHPLLRHAPAIRHDDGASTFVMTRVAPGTTCDDL